MREDPKTILLRARSIQRRMDQRKAELTRLREMRSYITGTDYSAVRVSRSGESRPVERMALDGRALELEELLRGELEQLEAAKIEAIRLTQMLDNWKHQNVLWEYYINCARNWDAAADAVGYSRQHAVRLHGEALQELREKMRLNESMHTG